MLTPVHPGGPASLVHDGTEPGDHPASGDPPAQRPASGVTVIGRPAGDVVTVRELAWHHLAAVALRESLAAELLYSGRPESLPGQASARGGGVVAYTGVAFTPEGLPVGHAALRWSEDDVELQRVYVTPPYRGSGTAAALLAAAEDAARALHARRILVRPGGQQPEDARFWEQAGYTPVSSTPPLASHCLGKLIMSGPPE